MNASAAPQFRFRASVLAVLVHAAFFALLVFGITWQAKEPAGVVVDLWANLPAVETRPSAPPPPPAAEPEPVKAEPIKKIEPKPTPQKLPPDIALKEKRALDEKRKQELLRAETRMQAQRKQEQMKLDQTRQAEAARQEQARAEMARRAQAQQSAAQQSIVNDYTSRIQSKIRSKLNKTLCGDGKPQLEFDIALLPTGQLNGNPVLRKGSGIAACDKAVESAILQSDPLPVPQTDAFNFFRELHLKFKPNE